MRIVKPYMYIFESELNRNKLLNIERSARLCYKSEEKIGNEASQAFLNGILSRGHESVIEHEKITVYFVVDRGVTHEIVRHRIASYSQESTRYCNYNKDKFGSQITVIEPFFYSDNDAKFQIWKRACEAAEKAYIDLVRISTPQEARSVLPNSLKTEIAVTFNFREWRHFFALRCAKDAHPQMQQVSIPLLRFLQRSFSPIFDDIPFNTDFPIDNYAQIKIIK